MKKYSMLILYLFLFVYLEFVSKVLMFNKLIDLRFIYTILFSLVTALILFIVSKLFKAKTNKIISGILLCLITFFYVFNYLYYSLLATPFSVSVLELADQAFDFWDIAFHVINIDLISILIMLLPIVLYFTNQKVFDYEPLNKKNIACLICTTVISYFGCLLTLNFDKENLYSAYNLYYKTDSIIDSTDVLGVFTTQRLNIKRNIFGFEEQIVLEPDDNPEEIPEEITYNQMDWNFDELIAQTDDSNLQNIYDYLKDQTPTNKNKYTGLYKGKNLIFVLAEGFNSIAVDENRTPMLYKMIHEGFDFTNFYSPVFLSTTGGEFQATTSLIPTSEILGLWRQTAPTFSYAIGNAFTKLGYKAQSYHDWTYSYYSRNKTMPTQGFTDYTACGNGLENEINCKWLPSDVDLIKATLDKYADNTPFVTYYISVSGHAPYNFTGGNSISIKNQEAVADLPYSDSVRAYLAAQLEFEYAMEALVQGLDEKGILDDTVIVIVGDHYPYTLTVDEINEVSTYERDKTVEVNHSNLIIWNNKKVDTTINKVASQLDVLPTILNLFGVEYDSRLLIGNDIFSDKEGLAIFSDRSWRSDLGVYYSATKEFIANDGVEIPENYIQNMNVKIANYFTMSKLMLQENIYTKLVER